MKKLRVCLVAVLTGFFTFSAVAKDGDCSIPETTQCRQRLVRSFQRHVQASSWLRRETPLVPGGSLHAGSQEKRDEDRTRFNRKVSLAWELMVEDYLQASETRYVRGKDKPGHKTFKILADNQGSWLNRIAVDLQRQAGTRLALNPGGLLRMKAYGLYGGEGGNLIQLVMPPLAGTPFEVLSHEIYHALTIPMRYEEKPHWLSGVVTPLQGFMSGVYPEMDWTEVGAFLHSIEAEVKSFDEADVRSVYTWTLLRYHWRMFQDSSREIARFIDYVATHPTHLDVVHAETKEMYSLSFLDETDRRMFIWNFGQWADLDVRGVDPTSTEFTASYWKLTSLHQKSQEKIWKPLRFLQSLFHEFNSQSEVVGEAVHKGDLNGLKRGLVDLRQLLFQQNRRWLEALKVPAESASAQMDQQMVEFIERQLNCERNLRE